ncbi:MAG: hypothetical protein AAFO07_19225, partial [Bacteroidota bacterium]
FFDRQFFSLIKGKFIDNDSEGNGGAIYLEDTYETIIYETEFTGNEAENDGGAIYMEDYEASIKNSKFIENKAEEDGGAIFTEDIDSLKVYMTEFNHNSSGENGGAIYNYDENDNYPAVLVIKDSKFEKNETDEDYYGGAVYTYYSDSVYISNTKFLSNVGDYEGGAIYTYYTDTLTILGSEFIGNECEYGGGAIYYYQDSDYSQGLLIKDTKFEDNEVKDDSYYGGAIYFTYAHGIIDNCNFKGNISGYGGAIFNYYVVSLDILNSHFVENESYYYGGAIKLDDYESDSTIITNCLFDKNKTGEYGGAIYAEDAYFAINDSEFKNNRVTEDGEYGGAIYTDDSYGDIISSSFKNNFAGYGGAALFYDDSYILVEDCEFLNNEAEYDGGAIYLYYGYVTMDGITIQQNTAANEGGGIYAYYPNEYYLLNSVVSANTAQDGGGVFTMEPYSDDAYIVNSEITGNMAWNRGGGLYNQSDYYDLYITNSVISGNMASLGGGIYNEDFDPYITNTIIWNNKAEAATDSPSASIFDDDDSDSEINNSIVENLGAANAELANGNKDQDPEFLSPLDPALAPSTGGDFRIKRTSPAINMGDNDADAEDGDGASTISDFEFDKAGDERIQEEIVDIGPYEKLSTAACADPFIDAARATYQIADCEETTSFIYTALLNFPCGWVEDAPTSIASACNVENCDNLLLNFLDGNLVLDTISANAILITHNAVDVPAGEYQLGYTLEIGGYTFTTDFDIITVLPSPEPNVEDLACNDDVNVTLGDVCTSVVTADMVLEGDNICNDLFTVVVDYGMGMKTVNEITECGKFKYEVYVNNGNTPITEDGADVQGEEDPRFVCWGYITGEDKDAPLYDETTGPFEAKITCTDIDSLSKYSASDIQLKKDGEDCFFAGKTWDILESQGVFFVNEIYDNCTQFCHLSFEINDLLMDGDVCAGELMVLRTIRVTDEKGNTSTFEVRFVAEQIDLKFDEVVVNDSIDLCTYPNAGDDNFLAKSGTPYWYSYCVDVDGNRLREDLDDRFFQGTNTASLCGWAVTYEDTKLPIECDGNKIIRKWTALDWCGDEPFATEEIGEQLIKVGYFAAPTVAANDWQKAEESTGAFDCTATVTILPPAVTGCKPGNFEYTIKLRQKIQREDGFGVPIEGEYDYPLVSTSITQNGDEYIAADLPIGTYKVEYFVTNECGVNAEGSFELAVKDLTEPVPVVDDELNVSIGGDGIGRVCVEDVDEGTWDNCELKSTDIRRELWDEVCRQAYLEEVLEVASLDELLVQEFSDGTKIWYRFEGVKRINLVHLDLTKDGLQYFTWWADCVYFTCCDISESMEDFVVVEFRAVDKYDNTNVSWMDVLIENKLTPTCIPPADVDFTCLDFKLDGGNIDEVRATFGTVEELLAANTLSIDFNCEVEVTDTIEWTPGDCSEGVLKRIFTVMAPTTRGIMSTTCTQTIDVRKIIDYQIKFPADAEDTCEGDGGEDLEIETYGCDIFAIDRDTVEFDVVADYCFKRYVTYTVINWCEYDGITLEPTVVPRDVDCDEDLDECTWVRVKNVEGMTAYIDDDNDPMNEPVEVFSTSATSYDACDGNTYGITAGFWQYTQVIKVYDNEAPIIDVDTLEFCAYGLTGAQPCNGEVMIPFTVADSCTEDVEVRSVMLLVNNSGEPVNGLDDLYILTDLGNGDYTISSIDGEGLPEGAHTFMVTVADECGNVQVRNIPFTIADCKTPAPVCISILSIDLMPVVENKEVVDGMNVVWATDFVASSIFDCNPHPQADPLDDGKNEVKYYAVRVDTLLARGLDAPTSDYLTDEYRDVAFSCADEGTAVAVFVIGVDGLDNFDYCTVMVNVESGQDPCDGGVVGDAAAVAGLI